MVSVITLPKNRKGYFEKWYIMKQLTGRSGKMELLSKNELL